MGIEITSIKEFFYGSWVWIVDAWKIGNRSKALSKKKKNRVIEETIIVGLTWYVALWWATRVTTESLINHGDGKQVLEKVKCRFIRYSKGDPSYRWGLSVGEEREATSPGYSMKGVRREWERWKNSLLLYRITWYTAHRYHLYSAFGA